MHDEDSSDSLGLMRILLRARLNIQQGQNVRSCSQEVLKPDPFLVSIAESTGVGQTQRKNTDVTKGKANAHDVRLHDRVCQLLCLSNNQYKLILIVRNELLHRSMREEHLFGGDR